MIGRRTFGSALLSGVVACSRRENKDSPRGPVPVVAPPEDGGAALRGAVRVVKWTLPQTGTDGASTPTPVVALVPAWGAPGERFPVLIALHGRGEAMKKPEDGAMGWAKDYDLTRAIARLGAPPLTDADFEGFSDRARMAAHNDALRAKAFGGVIVLCPYLFDIDLVGSNAIRAYGRFLVTTLLPHARRETPAIDTPHATGIDGVSLGGAVALRAGLMFAESFGAIGTLQPALHEEQTQDLVALARAGRQKNAALQLRLLTSDQDYFKAAVYRVSSAWKQAGVAHEMVEVPGPHDYAFNRGPGALEMMLWHDRALR